MTSRISFVSIDDDLAAYKVAKFYPDEFRTAFVYKETFFSNSGLLSALGSLEPKAFYVFFLKEENGLSVIASRDVKKLMDYYDLIQKPKEETDGN